MDAETKNRIIGELAVRYKMRLDPDDPAFMLIEMNRIALESAAADSTRELKDSVSELSAQARALEERAAAIVDTIAATSSQGELAEAKRLLAETRAALEKVNEAAGVLVVQTAGIGQTINHSSIDYDHARQKLSDAIDRASRTMENPAVAQVASYEKTVFGITVIAVLVVAAAAGFFYGRMTANSAQSEFAQLNDVTAMMRCSAGIPETQADGSRICTLAIGGDPTRRVIGWNIK